MYCDEFSWAFSWNTYSRYDYSRWDGYSADLGEDGNVTRLKADAAFVTESCQLRMTWLLPLPMQNPVGGA